MYPDVSYRIRGIQNRGQRWQIGKSRGCFKLSKWTSNSQEILVENTAADSLVPLKRKTTESKTLGLLWVTNRDCFRYSSYLPVTKKVTKRSILSIPSQIFDPLGLLSPVKVKAKILMQELWSLELWWDESVPTVLHSTWNEWLQELHKSIKSIRDSQIRLQPSPFIG
jgi:hypothetical protein